MSLSSPPPSPEAERLLHNIIDIITIAEQRKRARQPIHLAAFQSAVGMIVGDVNVGFQTRDTGLSYLSMSTAAFSDRPIGYRTFKRIFFALDKIS